MDTKRKANGATPMETNDRASKRRKLAEDYDLSRGESRESTTAYGVAFLDLLRRTADKGGRLVATSFEELPTRKGNKDYYERTRMPISLGMIDEKLENGEFENLSELEGYFKRMISNAKEFYPRSSPTFEDAERIRKALSNYMSKKNPAYSARGYQALATPLPPEDGEDDEDAAPDSEEIEAAGEEGADGEDEEEAQVEAKDEDDEEDKDEDDEQDEDEEEEDEDEEEDEEEEEEKRPARGRKKRSIILKRRGPGRPPSGRRASMRSREAAKPAAPPAKPDHQYEDVPYKGLTFQQAQEKIVEELLRHQEPEYEDAYFEAFINLPPRALKDYYQVIKDPLSIKKLQKLVKGVHNRGDAPGTTDFKTWSAFEEKVKLLWTNATFYNEEGSEIYTLAQELEVFFYDHFKQAQAAAPEPAGPKIKLKVGQAAETATPKKITIHVGGRGDSTDFPASQTQKAETNGSAVNGAAPSSQPAHAQLDKTRSLSASASSPAPSTQAAPKSDGAAAAAASSAVVSQPTTAAPGQTTPAVLGSTLPVAQPQPAPPPVPTTNMEPKHPRRSGKSLQDALLSQVRIQIHPSFQMHSPTIATILPHPTEMRQSATVNLPPHLTRILILPKIPDHLHERQYSLWTLVNKQPLRHIHQPVPGQVPQERAFEAVLHPGVNVVESHVIAAIPRSERVPGGPEADLEIFTILVNVLRN